MNVRIHCGTRQRGPSAPTVSVSGFSSLNKYRTLQTHGLQTEDSTCKSGHATVSVPSKSLPKLLGFVLAVASRDRLVSRKKEGVKH